MSRSHPFYSSPGGAVTADVEEPRNNNNGYVGAAVGKGPNLRHLKIRRLTIHDSRDKRDDINSLPSSCIEDEWSTQFETKHR
jgi:hypothetical protein